MPGTPPKRLQLTLQDRLRTLDDTLYLLTDALSGLQFGGDVHLQTITTGLRSLVCRSTKEGLLWRLVEHYGISDTVDVHLPGHVDTTHPLTKGLSFFYVPIVKAGYGVSDFPAQPHSLKSIIKTHELVFLLGKGYTHEQIIKASSQQLGLAHHDDSVDEHLAELGEVLFSNRVSLVRMMEIDVMLVNEVGERLLAEVNFPRSPRSARSGEAPISAPISQVPPTWEGTPLGDQFTIAFTTTVPKSGWLTDQMNYRLEPASACGITVTMSKLSDRMLQFELDGFRNGKMFVHCPAPADGREIVMIVITFKSGTVSVYVNGRTEAVIENVQR